MENGETDGSVKSSDEESKVGTEGTEGTDGWADIKPLSAAEEEAIRASARAASVFAPYSPIEVETPPTINVGMAAKLRLETSLLIFRLRMAIENAIPALRRATHVAARTIADFTAPPPPWRDWQIDFGTVSGKAGEVKRLEVEPQCNFRGEKVMATDTGGRNGMGTRIGVVLVGDKLQRPPLGARTPTLFFSNNALGNGLKWDPCRAGLKIVMEVEFVEDCEFFCTVFGKATII